MLQPILHKLASKRIVLASSSPRREQLLRNIGLSFEIIPSTYEENLDKGSFEKPYQYVKETAKYKALQVAEKLQKEIPADLVVGADTVVTLDGEIIGKPKDETEAFSMLERLSGRTHTVYTGVVLVTPNNQGGPDSEFNIRSFHEATDVTMTRMTSDIIKYYISTKEPMDKAGAYGIQEIGGTLVEGIRGDYFTVMGLPLHRLCIELVQIYK